MTRALLSYLLTTRNFISSSSSCDVGLRIGFLFASMTEIALLYFGFCCSGDINGYALGGIVD